MEHAASVVEEETTVTLSKKSCCLPFGCFFNLPLSKPIMEQVKLMIVGSDTVGKTSFIYSYFRAPTEFDGTDRNKSPINVTWNDTPVNLSIWDTAGSADFDRLRPLSYDRTDVFLAAFSIISQASFEAVASKWIDEIRHHCPRTPIVLVGMKADLQEDEVLMGQLRDKGMGPVLEKQAHDLVTAHNLAGYITCSSLKHESLVAVLDMAIGIALSHKNRQQSAKCHLM